MQWQQYEAKVAQRGSTRLNFQPDATPGPTPAGVGMETPLFTAVGAPQGGRPYAGLPRSPLSATFSMAAVTSTTPLNGFNRAEKRATGRQSPDSEGIPAVKPAQSSPPPSAAGTALPFFTPMTQLRPDDDPALQQASTAFLQQVEQLHRKYALQVEHLKTEVQSLGAQRDSLADDVRAATAAAQDLVEKRASTQRDLAQASGELSRARDQLRTLEAAAERERSRLEVQRSQMLASMDAEAASMRERLAAEQRAARAAIEEGEISLHRQTAALADRAQRIDESANGLADRDAELQECELDFEAQVREITRSLKEREVKLREAEDMAAQHLGREKALLEKEEAINSREQALKTSQKELEAKTAELRASEASISEERRRLEAAAQAQAAKEAAAALEQNAREQELSARENELQVATRRFEELCAQQVEAEEDAHAKLIAEAEAVQMAADEAAARAQHASAEEASARERLNELRLQIQEVESARTDAVAAKEKAEAGVAEARRKHEAVLQSTTAAEEALARRAKDLEAMGERLRVRQSELDEEAEQLGQLAEDLAGREAVSHMADI